MELLEAGDFVSALTLAGAAEEIFGRMAARKGNSTKVEDNAAWLASMYDFAGKPRPTKRRLISALNNTRNHLKHNDHGRNISIEADFEFEAEEMLLRAMFNHLKAFGCLPGNKTLRNWFIHMTI